MSLSGINPELDRYLRRDPAQRRVWEAMLTEAKGKYESNQDLLWRCANRHFDAGDVPDLISRVTFNGLTYALAVDKELASLKDPLKAFCESFRLNADEYLNHGWSQELSEGIRIALNGFYRFSEEHLAVGRT